MKLMDTSVISHSNAMYAELFDETTTSTRKHRSNGMRKTANGQTERRDWGSGNRMTTVLCMKLSINRNSTIHLHYPLGGGIADVRHASTRTPRGRDKTEKPTVRGSPALPYVRLCSHLKGSK